MRLLNINRESKWDYILGLISGIVWCVFRFRSV